MQLFRSTTHPHPNVFYHVQIHRRCTKLQIPFEVFVDDFSRHVTILLAQWGMSAMNMIQCFITGCLAKHLTSKLIAGYLSISCWGNALQKVCVAKPWNKTQLQPASSDVAIPTSKPNIGNVSINSIIIEVMIAGVTLFIFIDATTLEYLMVGSMMLYLNTRCSSASIRLFRIDIFFCLAEKLVTLSLALASLVASFTSFANAWNICIRRMMLWVSSPAFSLLDL